MQRWRGNAQGCHVVSWPTTYALLHLLRKNDNGKVNFELRVHVVLHMVA